MRERLTGVRVLLVEDNLVNRLVATRLLEKTGCTVTAVENGLLAIDRVHEESFDLVLMDCQMPVMDGFTAAQKLSSDPDVRVRRTPVVAMTAEARQSARDECLACGMRDFITKPVDPEELVLLIERNVSMPEHVVIDEARLTRNFQVDTQMVELMVMHFLRTANGILRELDACVREGDLAMWRRHLLGLKVNAGTVGAVGVIEHVAELLRLERPPQVEDVASLCDLLDEVHRWYPRCRAS